ncbi:MAG: tetratricopeptide repeat protein [Planctomycetes bacterium]|jgi:tetratricopeptide (TPR) repeat protein|nr:tetratricopeptide repeat protein [Planctomycetota bacterium]MBT4029222.1 tetratricopeptide repeat protein [Planctomycetota bacterium]MBT4559303.1 tetratricopeptide repeat protein [Planctomycetota bacterium]MBT5101612.1 tetratricopeptide repeat protein [Planctomycetota bacterium]MBT5121053.1 tetratricopeptide repeat protein [Planctomycetota bacterium]
MIALLLSLSFSPLLSAVPAPIATVIPQEAGDPSAEVIALRSARNAMAMKKPELAAERYEELLGKFPDSIDARAEYAGVLLSLDRLAAAKMQFEELIHDYPEAPRFRISLTDIYLQQNEFEHAAEQLEFILATNPGNVKAAIKLARIHAWAKDYEAAGEVYRTYLRKLDPGDPEVQAMLAPLLIDTQRPADALPILKDLLAKDPENLELTADLARAHTMLGNHREANGLVSSCKKIDLSNVSTRLSLSEYLRNAGNFRGAIELLDQVLAYDSSDLTAKYASARLHIAAYMPHKAMRILSDKAFERDSIEYLTVLADHHKLLGEYAHAKEVYYKILRTDSANDAAHLSMAQLLAESGQAQAAKAEYRKVSDASALSREAALGIAQTLASEHRYDDSNAHCRRLMADESDHRPITIYIRNLLALGETAQAETLALRYLNEQDASSYSAMMVRTALADALLADGQALRAQNLYEEVLSDPIGSLVPEAIFGRAMAIVRLSEDGGAENAMLQSSISGMGGDFRLLIRLGEIASQNSQYMLAAAMFEQVLSWDSGNLPALMRHAEALASERDAALAMQSQTEFEKVLRQANSSIRARMGLARTFGAMQQFDEAIKQYDIVLQHDPSYVVALREKARVYSWAQNPEAAERIYWKLQHPGPRTDISGVGNLEHAQLDNAARSEVEASTKLEQRAKAFGGDLAFYNSIPVLRSLVSSEPGNLEARFDLGLAYSQTGQTNLAINEFDQLLKLSPKHREGIIARTGNLEELKPRFYAELDLLSRKSKGITPGTGASLDIRGLTLGTVIPWGQRDEFIDVSYTNFDLAPSGQALAGSVTGNVLSLSAQKSPTSSLGQWKQMLFHGALNLESYVDDLDATATWEAGIKAAISDQSNLFARAFQENVIENQNSLLSETDFRTAFGDWRDNEWDGGGTPPDAYITNPVSRTGIQAGLSYRPTREIFINGSLTSASYSDGNAVTQIYATADLAINKAPKELKVGLIFHSMDFDDITWDGYLDQMGPVRYFAPNGYSMYGASGKYRQWLSQDMFPGAPQTWYQASLTQLWDSEGEPFSQIKLEFHHDLTAGSGINLRADMLDSAFYDSTQFVFTFGTTF